ncbi:hypothetical protein [Microbacterium sp. WCS2018Hpa-23]|uniref:hypothetical protein n=1 Tax=Microbacterium sp. WCS2018Hpa-23 TaxID=3073634 RepID=UPI002882EBD5|nr:hypothetical protein [Microbacterium sp. WCS2018Hpa-23]
MPATLIAASARAPQELRSATPMRTSMRVVMHPGTNGWTSVWGTLSHGEIAGCPPPRD